MKIGFIGLGNLGMPIAENILQKQKQFFVYNRTSSKTKPFVGKGATVCDTIKDLAGNSDIVFSVVSDDAALNSITNGSDGIAENLKAGGIHVSVSTILPATAHQLSQIHSQHNNYYIAAPVMGRPEAARAGKLNFLVSGEKNAIETIKPFLQDAGGAGIWEFGSEVAAANVAKLCSNFLIVSAIEAMAEGINLATKSGVDASTWISMMTQTLFASPVYINYSNILLKEIFQPAGFALRLGLKDVNLVMQQAEDAKAKMPVAKLMQQRLNDCVENGFGDYDWTAVALTLK
ncbi:MAG TPA: NAD(P)-dependent oxidoreductase [Chitinophagaceae bacterium]|jgi:3-hydroxyisobutyrate dehydrogenase-like beta-hydroxyacid dehydrogenase